MNYMYLFAILLIVWLYIFEVSNECEEKNWIGDNSDLRRVRPCMILTKFDNILTILTKFDNIFTKAYTANMTFKVQPSYGSSLTGITGLCPWARHINPSLVLVQPRKTHAYIPERLLMVCKESNQTKPTKL